MARRPNAARDRFLSSTRTRSERTLLARAIDQLDERHALWRKIEREPELAEIVEDFIGRLQRAFGSLTRVKDKRILDIASGSNSSRSPTTGKRTAMFEPWFARLLVELGQNPSRSIAAISMARDSSTTASTLAVAARSISWYLRPLMACRTVSSASENRRRPHP